MSSRGAHRLDNCTSEMTRVLVVSTMIAPELNEYPDSGKLWGLAFAPGAASTTPKRQRSSAGLRTTAITSRARASPVCIASWETAEP